MDIEEVFYEVEYDANTTVQLADLDYFKLHPTLTWIYLCFLVISTVIGNIGNLLVIATVLVCDKLRTKTNVFVVSLAIADLNVASVVQYFSIVGLVVGYKFFIDKNWLCHLVTFICQISCVASLLNMAAVAINRYICICHRKYYHKVYTKTNLSLMVVLIWFLSFLVDIGPLMGWWGGHSYDAKTMLCSWNRLADFSYTVFFVCVILSPIGLVLFCYVSIFVKVRKTRTNVTRMGGRVDKGNGEANNVQLVKSLFIIFIVFLLCWFPYAIVVVTDFADRFPKAVHVFTIQFAHTNSSVNSVIYGMSNPTFRNGYIQVMRRCLPKYFTRKQPDLVESSLYHGSVLSTRKSTIKHTKTEFSGTKTEMKRLHKLHFPGYPSKLKLTSNFSTKNISIVEEDDIEFWGIQHFVQHKSKAGSYCVDNKEDSDFSTSKFQTYS